MPAPAPSPAPVARPRPPGFPVLLGIAVLLSAAKLWLGAAQPLTAAAHAANDDALFIRLAASLLHGEWLGAYDHLTLSKGAAYPLFIATAHLLHLPLPLAQQLLYAVACAALAAALAPLFRLRWLPWLLYLVLLYNPMTLEGPVMARVLRQHLATPATMLALAGFAGLWLHRGAGYYQKILWAAAAGVGLATAWLCREETSLLLPAAVVFFLLAVFAHRHVWSRPPTWILFALPWLIWCSALTTVCALNLHHYGAWTTVEFRATAFNEAYGALVRVRPQRFQPYVPVARETRERIYRVSPAFAELRPYLEGEPGRNWASFGSSLTGQPPEAREIAGGWFMWALRDAVAHAGHTRDARTALAFYRRLADEVNAACRDGRLDARPPRSGFLPSWHEAYHAPLRQTLGASLGFLSSFAPFSPGVAPSSGDSDGLALFAKITRAQLAPTADAATAPLPIDDWRPWLLRRLALGYQWFTRPLTFVALAVFFILWLSPRRSHHAAPLITAGLLAFTLALTLGAIALIQISSFPTLLTGYFHGSYPLLLAFVFIGLGGALDWLGTALRPRLPRSAS